MKTQKPTTPKIKKKILLVEDDNAIRRYIEVVLQKEDFDVIIAEDGLSAIQMALSNEIDAILTDARMPNMSGQDLCRMVRQNPAKRHVSTIIMSGVASEPDENIADAYLTKDLNFKENLVLAVKDLLFKPSLSPA
jgi:DNA-binding response OmpR family regulator